MKKLILFISSIIIFLGCFIGLGLDSFAYDQDFTYPTAGVTVSAEWTSNNVTNKIEFESIYPLLFYKNSDTHARICSPLQYGRVRSFNSSFQEDFGSWYSISWQKINDDPTLYAADTIPLSASTSNVIIFKDIQSVLDYLEDPENSDNLDNLYNGVGQDILEDSIIPDIDWGSNGSPLDYDGSPDTYNIPAPQFNISYDSNGNVIHSITFTNFEYDSRRQDGKYGIVMNASWGTFDDFSLTHTGSLFDTTYSVTYGVNISDRPVFDIFDVPEKVNDINYCPQSLNFNQNTISLNEFNNMINMNPVASRTVNVPASEPNDILENQFKDYLSKPQCPYNYLVFSCYYYKPNGDGTYSFGPTTTGAFYPPNQGAIYNAGRFNGQDGNMQPGSGGGAGGNGGNWNNNWGNGNTNINLDYGSNVDPSQLVNNMNSLLGFIGNVPNFVTQLFSFLPEWLIIFIAVSIGLMVAIGVVKLFLG